MLGIRIANAEATTTACCGDCPHARYVGGARMCYQAKAPKKIENLNVVSEFCVLPEEGQAPDCPHVSALRVGLRWAWSDRSALVVKCLTHTLGRAVSITAGGIEISLANGESVLIIPGSEFFVTMSGPLIIGWRSGACGHRLKVGTSLPVLETLPPGPDAQWTEVFLINP